MANKYIYFLRHGQSEANTKHQFGLDLPLSEKGIMQAIDTREYFDGFINHLGIILCSDMRRSYETAFRVFPDKNSFVVDRRFREIYFGRLEGTLVGKELISELQSNPMLIHKKYKGDHVKDRADTAIRTLYNFSNLSFGDLVIVGHDTLFECILWLLGYYELVNEGKQPFLLWADKCRFPNCAVLRVPVWLFEKYLEIFSDKEPVLSEDDKTFIFDPNVF